MKHNFFVLCGALILGTLVTCLVTLEIDKNGIDAGISYGFGLIAANIIVFRFIK